MNKTRLVTLLLWVLWGSVWAQNNLPYRVPITGYRGNVIVSDSLAFTPTDTLLLLTAESRNNINLDGPLTTPQPTLVRKGLKGVVRFATSDKLPQLGWWRVKVGGQTKYDGELKVGTTAIAVTPKDVTIVATFGAQLGNLQAQLNALQQVTKMLDPTDITYLNLYSQLLLYK